jgi:hypothetical protein
MTRVLSMQAEVSLIEKMKKQFTEPLDEASVDAALDSFGIRSAR